MNFEVILNVTREMAHKYEHKINNFVGFRSADTIDVVKHKPHVNMTSPVNMGFMLGKGHNLTKIVLSKSNNTCELLDIFDYLNHTPYRSYLLTCEVYEIINDELDTDRIGTIAQIIENKEVFTKFLPNVENFNGGLSLIESLKGSICLERGFDKTTIKCANSTCKNIYETLITIKTGDIHKKYCCDECDPSYYHSNFHINA